MPAKIVATPTIPVSAAPHTFRRAGLLVPFLALGLVALCAFLRIQRVRQVSAVADWPAPEARGASGDPVGRLPRMVVPGSNNESFEWMDQTRQMLAEGDLRVRHVDYENAPLGHDVRSASPYRWWLGSLAWIVHAFTGRRLGPSLEGAALVADPLLQMLFLAGTALFVARRFGGAPAALVCAAAAALYPLAQDFLPGVPNEQGLALAAGVWSVLPLLAGIAAGVGRRRLFFLAGVAGGLGLWISVDFEVPVVAGIGFGSLIAAWIARGVARREPAEDPEPLPWRAWALGGAVASLAAYLVEYFPSHLGSWELRAVHPIYGLAWLGLGEAVALAALGIQRGRAAFGMRDLARAAAALAALASLPFAMRLTHSAGFLQVDLPALRLTRLPGGVAASDISSWIYQDGLSAIACATLMPLLLAVPAVWLLLRPGLGFAPRAGIAVALGPVLVALGFACRQLTWWNGVDAALLALLVATTAALGGIGLPRFAPGAWFALAALILGLGLFQAFPRVGFAGQAALDESEVVGLIERDLARWLAIHAPPGGALVLAPTNLTTALYYYGGVRGLATLDWENRDGVQAAVRIVSATTPPEAMELVQQRGVTAIVLPSWDNQLDAFARLGLGHLENSFIDLVHHWSLIPWLRPTAYPLPGGSGFEGQSVLVMEVTDDQNEAILMSRMTEYFVESGNLDLAGSAASALKRFPADLGALVARAQVEVARGDADAFGDTVNQLLPRLSGEGERALPWDRRVALAVVLAQSKHMDKARSEVQRCADNADDEKLRSLPTGSLRRLLFLMRKFAIGMANPRLEQRALDLLPPDMRSGLGR